MFYELDTELKEISLNDVNKDKITIGIVNSSELNEINKKLNFDLDTVLLSQTANPMFRTAVDVHSDYTFTELRIVNSEGDDDFISLYIMKNFILIVDILDEDGSTKESFLKAIKKYPSNKVCIEKIICYFIESLLLDGRKNIENMRNEITVLEETVISGTAGKDMPAKLLDAKKQILKYQNYYGQILDITETLEENDNDIFEEDNVIYITNLSNRVSRTRDDIDSLSNSLDHLQDAYNSLMDQRLNNSMKGFTILTTIFFPLTIIVGWYGMNFKYMPELAWKYGYIYVALLSVFVVGLLCLIGKKKKWF